MKKVSRKLVSILVLSVMLLVVFASLIVQADDEKAVIRFAWWGSPGRHELYNSVVDYFEETYPNIEVEREYSGWGEYWDRLTTQAAGGNPPDVMQYNSYTISEYAVRGVLMDLEPFVNDGIIDLSGWDPVTKDLGRRNGKLYAIPFSYTIPAVFFNTQLLKEIGAIVPETNTTMTLNEFKDFALSVQKKLSDNGIDAYALYDPGTFENFFEAIIRQKGKALLSADGKELGFTKEDLTEYYTWLNELREAGVIPPAEVMAEEGDQPWENSMLIRNRVVMQSSNSNQLKVFQRYTEDELDIMRIPVDPDGELEHGEPLDYMTNAVSATAEYPEAAAKFVDFFTNNVEAQRRLNAEHGGPTSPAVLEALKDEFSTPIQRTIEHSQEVKKTVPPYYGRPAGIGPIIDGLLRGNDEIAFNVKSIEQAVNDFFRSAERTLRRR